MPSEVLAPKLSVLQKAFDRRDLAVVAIYIETCGGVPDHTAEFRRQIAKHRIDYIALDGEAGPVDDPTRKTFPWAPHAVLIDARGRIARTYGRMPRIDVLRTELEAVVTTGRIPNRPDDGWRAFPCGAWVEVRIEQGTRSRVERRRLKAVSRDGATLEVARTPDLGQPSRKEERVFREELAFKDDDHTRTEREPATVKVDDREVACRVFETRWTRQLGGGVEKSVEERSWIATDAALPDTLLRRETVERSADGGEVRETRRVVTLEASVDVGGKAVAAWEVETIRESKSGRSEERVWHARQVPGHEVKRVRKVRREDREWTESARVVAFGAR